MIGDPSKPEIMSANGYVTVWTRRRELWDKLRKALAKKLL
jgi:hypothetical protein